MQDEYATHKYMYRRINYDQYIVRSKAMTYRGWLVAPTKQYKGPSGSIWCTRPVFGCSSCMICLCPFVPFSPPPPSKTSLSSRPELPSRAETSWCLAGWVSWSAGDGHIWASRDSRLGLPPSYPHLSFVFCTGASSPLRPHRPRLIDRVDLLRRLHAGPPKIRRRLNPLVSYAVILLMFVDFVCCAMNFRVHTMNFRSMLCDCWSTCVYFRSGFVC